jgi:RimJ/RimL family protein N-acetyltransferase
MTATPALRGGRLVLEPLRVDHATQMAAVLSDAGLFTFTGGSPPSRTVLEQRYARQIAGPADPAQEWHNWVVRLGADGPAVGYVQATVSRADDVAELAWVVGSSWQGRGLAREAAALVLEHVRTTGVRRVVAHVHPDNVASQRVATALGLVPTERSVDGEVEWELVTGGQVGKQG